MMLSFLHIISHPSGLKLLAIHAVRHLPPAWWILTLCPLWLAGNQALGFCRETQSCSVVTEEDNETLIAKCVWLSQICNSRQMRWAITGQAQCLRTHTHTHTRRLKKTDKYEDLLCSQLYRHTAALAPLPWWGRPIGAKAKEHRLSLLSEHLWQPPTQKQEQIRRLRRNKYVID